MTVRPARRAQAPLRARVGLSFAVAALLAFLICGPIVAGICVALAWALTRKAPLGELSLPQVNRGVAEGWLAALPMAAFVAATPDLPWDAGAQAWAELLSPGVWSLAEVAPNIARQRAVANVTGEADAGRLLVHVEAACLVGLGITSPMWCAVAWRLDAHRKAGKWLRGEPVIGRCLMLLLSTFSLFVLWWLLDGPLVRRDSFRLGRWVAPEASVVGAAAFYAGMAFTCLAMFYCSVMIHSGFVVARRWSR